MSEGNERKCSRCEKAIDAVTREVHPDWAAAETIRAWAAWLSGFCSAGCQNENARHTVADGRAWWQSHRSGSDIDDRCDACGQQRELWHTSGRWLCEPCRYPSKP